MAPNKATTAIFIAVFAMIFAAEVALAHFHHLPRDDIRNPHGGFSTHYHIHHHHRHHGKKPCDNSVPHVKVNGFYLKMEKGHEACYIACYKNIFVRISSPLIAEAKCHHTCCTKRVSSMLSGSATVKPIISGSVAVTAKHLISSSVAATLKPTISASTSATVNPTISASASASTSAAVKPTISSSATATADHKNSPCSETTAKHTISSTNTATEKPEVSSTNTATEKPEVSSTNTAMAEPKDPSTNVGQTMYANPYA